MKACATPMFLNLSDREAEPPSLIAVFIRFLKFGLLAWGGPVAQIALVKRELVDEEKWLSPERFNRLLAIYQALPGPEAHELCVHLGMMKRGRMGGLLAGLGFMLPGEYTFNTADPELMEILEGDLDIWLPGSQHWQSIKGGESFNVPGNAQFTVKIKAPTDYCCSFLK